MQYCNALLLKHFPTLLFMTLVFHSKYKSVHYVSVAINSSFGTFLCVAMMIWAHLSTVLAELISLSGM